MGNGKWGGLVGGAAPEEAYALFAMVQHASCAYTLADFEKIKNGSARLIEALNLIFWDRCSYSLTVKELAF